MRSAIVIGLVLALPACTQRDAASVSDRTRSTAESAALTSKPISESDYGDRWPFVRLEASIECEHQPIGSFPSVALGDSRFAFTGATARLLRIPVVPDSEWRSDDNIGGGARVDIRDVRDDAFRFCDSPAPYNPLK